MKGFFFKINKNKQNIRILAMKRNSLQIDSQKENILMWISGKFIPDKTTTQFVTHVILK